jgi:hypothetical protein
MSCNTEPVRRRPEPATVLQPDPQFQRTVGAEGSTVTVQYRTGTDQRPGQYLRDTEPFRGDGSRSTRADRAAFEPLVPLCQLSAAHQDVRFARGVVGARADFRATNKGPDAGGQEPITVTFRTDRDEGEGRGGQNVSAAAQSTSTRRSGPDVTEFDPLAISFRTGAAPIQAGSSRNFSASGQSLASNLGQGAVTQSVFTRLGGVVIENSSNNQRITGAVDVAGCQTSAMTVVDARALITSRPRDATTTSTTTSTATSTTTSRVTRSVKSPASPVDRAIYKELDLLAKSVHAEGVSQRNVVAGASGDLQITASPRGRVAEAVPDRQRSRSRGSRRR